MELWNCGTQGRLKRNVRNPLNQGYRVINGCFMDVQGLGPENRWSGCFEARLLRGNNSPGDAGVQAWGSPWVTEQPGPISPQPRPGSKLWKLLVYAVMFQLGMAL